MSILLANCPKCDARMSPHPDGDVLWCQFCGETRADEEALSLLGVLKEKADQQITEYDPPGRDYDMSYAEKRALDLAWDCIQEGDMRAAEMVLEDALIGRRDTFADGWYLLALTTNDPAEKMRYLEHALAIKPHHEYAWRDKGVLEGLIPAGASPIQPEAGSQDVVEAEAETQDCPLCGGLITFDVGLGALICESCCYRPDIGLVTPRSFDQLENALLQRRFGFSKEWHVGARLLTCQNCGAQLTLTQTALKTQCPFCDSAQVLEEDAVDSFEEPDALIPFTIDRSAAAKALHQRMPAEIRGKVVRGDLWGVYLPFWSFKGLASVEMPPQTKVPLGMRLGAFDMGEALVAGITQPTQAVLYELMPYYLDALMAYDARYLGGSWAAQVYNVDVVQASLTARAYAKHVARQCAMSARYSPPPVDLARTDSHAYNPPDTPLWRIARCEIHTLHYRLLLLPVWMITLYLRSGAHMPAVVNGQTGEALLSESFMSPETIIAGPGRAHVAPLPLVPERGRGPVNRPARSVIRPLEPLAADDSVIRPITLD